MALLLLLEQALALLLLLPPKPLLALELALAQELEEPLMLELLHTEAD